MPSDRVKGIADTVFLPDILVATVVSKWQCKRD